jgi:uncharacterized protein YcnI
MDKKIFTKFFKKTKGVDTPREQKNDQDINYDKQDKEEQDKILQSILEKKDIEEKYFSDKFKNILQKALESAIVHLIFNSLNIPEKYISLISKETIDKIKTHPEHQKKIEEGILRRIQDGWNIPDEYILFASNKTLQRALERGIIHRISYDGYILKNYISLCSKETIKKIRNNPEYQEKIMRGIINCISENLHPIETYIPLCSKETIKKIKSTPEYQEEIRRGIVKSISNGWEIQNEYLFFVLKETLQDALEEGIVLRISSGLNISKQYIFLSSKETLDKIKTHPEHQKKIEEGIFNRVLKGLNIPEEYISLSSEEEFQRALELGIVSRIEEGLDIPHQYARLLSSETLYKIRNNLEYQRKIMQGIIYRISESQDLDISQQYVYFMNEENASMIKRLTKELMEDVDFLKDVLKLKVKLFFNDFSQLDQEINEEVEKLADEEIKEIVWGKTMLPIGIKIHTRDDSLLSKFLKKTLGFVAHSQETAFLSNPVSNTKIVELALNALKNKFQKEGKDHNFLDKESYYQVCVPHRLNNRFCGIATIGFLLARDNIFQYNENLIKSNQNTIGLTIYDAGGILINDFFIPTKDRKITPVEFDGRTDMLLCKGIKDIELAHFLLSLLVNADYRDKNLFFQDIAKDFILEFKNILKKYGKEDWLFNQFINISPEDTKSIESLGSIFIEITNIRDELNRKIKENNKLSWIYESINNISLLFFDELGRGSKLEGFFKLIDEIVEKTTGDSELNQKIIELKGGFQLLSDQFSKKMDIEGLYKEIKKLQKEIKRILFAKLEQYKIEIQNNLYQEIKNLIGKYKNLVYPGRKLINIRDFMEDF